MNVPAELTEQPRWVLWREEESAGRKTKVPYHVNGGLRHASSTNPDTWTTFGQARQLAAEYAMSGVGFCLGNGIAGVDFDGCRNPETGVIDEWALTELRKLNSYTEVSPSGTGVKVFVRANLPGPGVKAQSDHAGHGGKQRAIEMYDAGRYFAVTGAALPDFSLTIETRNVGELYTKVARQKQQGKAHNLAVAQSAVAGGEKIPSGQRHDFILAHAGRLLRDGISLPALVVELQRINREMFENPKSPEEISKQARDFFSRWKTAAVGVNKTVIRKDMPETVLDGRLGELCQRRMADFPLAYSWCSLLTSYGALIPRGNTPLRTNLFFCAVGDVGSSKSLSMEYVFRLLGVWQDHPVLLKAKYGSAEALIERLEDVEPGATRIVFPDELKHLLDKANIQNASFAPVFNTAYSQDCQEGGTRGKQFKLDCRLSLIGGVVESLFDECFNAATVGGFYDRFLFGLCPQPYQHLYLPFEGSAEQPSPSRPIVDPQIWEARNQWVKEEGIAPRVAENALRCAYICACADGRTKLSVSELEPALNLAKYQTDVRLLLTPNPGETADAKLAIRVQAWLAKHAAEGGWIERRELYRAVNAHRYGPVAFDRCLKGLVYNHDIEMPGNQKTLRLIP